ncbi:MAG: helix-turn-helix domain-containing protein [Pseudomonadota bacterium]|nr:helix-turn-helix domain-containing protein [Pseudomonadota bacterium]
MTGSDLRAFRETLGLSQVEFARSMGVERSHLSRVEAGGRTLTDRLELRLAVLRSVAIEAVKSARLDGQQPKS